MNERTRKIIDNHNEGKYLSDMLFVAEYIRDLKENNQGDEKLREVSIALAEIAMYVNSLHMDRNSFHLALNQKFEQVQELRKQLNDKIIK